MFTLGLQAIAEEPQKGGPTLTKCQNFAFIVQAQLMIFTLQ